MGAVAEHEVVDERYLGGSTGVGHEPTVSSGFASLRTGRDRCNPCDPSPGLADPTIGPTDY
jgi:hypothetical protein